MATSNDASGTSSLSGGAARAPLVIALLVVVAVGGAYYGYYHERADYYTGRNLRLLGMLTAQIEGRIDLFEDFLRANLKGGTYAPVGMEFKPCADEIVAVKSGDKSGDKGDKSAGAAAARPEKPDPDVIHRGIEEKGSGSKVVLVSGGVAAADSTGAASPPRCATISLADFLRPIFARRVTAAFDALLVADTNGKVLYSVRPPPSSSTLLRHEEEWIDEDEEPPPPQWATGKATTKGEKADTAPATTTSAAQESAIRGAVADRESGSAVVMTSLGALSRLPGWREQTQPLDLVALARSTGNLQVELNGTHYVLFTQPYTFARGPASITGTPQQWIVCGLVSASRFRYDATAVSTTIILIAVAIGILAVCCWPFLRTALIHPSQALTITDVVLLVVCTIIGTAVITLALLDAFAYRDITGTADEQLKQFSEAVNADFGKNVVRAMKVLDAAEEKTADEARKPSNLRVPNLPQDLVDNESAGLYPYIDAITWIGDKGMQQVRFARIFSPSIDVSTRQYFQLAKKGRTSAVNGRDYVLEWVRSKATGEVRAVLAKKTTVPELPVIALTTELIDVSDAVRPPGVEMAIIDESGEVIYHSDTERIGYENFFAEADRNRELRSAVIARRAGAVSASYWGEDQSMYALPLTGSHWTLVTFRPRRLTRVLNVEAALLTLVLLLSSSTPYVLICIIVLILAPGYRAPRLWPDSARWRDYLRLSIILLAILALFVLNIALLSPWASFFGVLIIPALSLVSVYLVLHRSGEAPRRFTLAKALWLFLNVALIFEMLAGDVDPERFTDYPWMARPLLVTAALFVAVLTNRVLSRWQGGVRMGERLAKLRERLTYSQLYHFCGVLLLAIGVALPVVGFFAISRRVESELLVKYGQLRVAADLEHRIDRLETLTAVRPNSQRVLTDVLGNRLGHMFGSRWALNPPARDLPSWLCFYRPSSKSMVCDPTDQPTIPPWAAGWLPALYEDSVAIRPLFQSGAADCLWHWHTGRRRLTLVRQVHFDTDVAALLGLSTPEAKPPEPKSVEGKPPEGKPPEENPAEENLVINSLLPDASLSGAQGDLSPAAALVHLAAMAVIVLALLAIFWLAVRFIAARVLLIDVGEPNWLRGLPLSPTLGDHIFLVRRDKKVADLTGDDPMGKGLPFLDVSFEELDRPDTRPDRADSWSKTLEILDSSAAGRNVRILDFEYGINDGTINEKKLQWLERLLALSDRTVIMVSSVSQAYMATTPPPPTELKAGVLWYFDRWQTLLERFVCITAEELELRDDESERRSATVLRSFLRRPSSWLDRETDHNSFLRRLAGELDPTTERGQLIDEIGERAETYYAGLWGSCREDEKLLLFQLAQNGLANGRNRRILRRLIARGLVRHRPNLELFSETFRLYVLGAARREDLVSRARAQHGASTWDSLRLPFFVIIISFLLLLFATQKDLLTTTTALAAAMTTGLPMIMKLIGVFTERRTADKT